MNIEDIIKAKENFLKELESFISIDDTKEEYYDINVKDFLKIFNRNFEI